MSQLRPINIRPKYLAGPNSRPEPVSEVRFEGDKKRKKRANDLAWQMNFAKMKLSHWHDLDNLNWESLEALLKSAKVDYQNLG